MRAGSILAMLAVLLVCIIVGFAALSRHHPKPRGQGFPGLLQDLQVRAEAFKGMSCDLYKEVSSIGGMLDQACHSSADTLKVCEDEKVGTGPLGQALDANLPEIQAIAQAAVLFHETVSAWSPATATPILKKQKTAVSALFTKTFQCSDRCAQIADQLERLRYRWAKSSGVDASRLLVPTWKRMYDIAQDLKLHGDPAASPWLKAAYDVRGGYLALCGQA